MELSKRARPVAYCSECHTANWNPNITNGAACRRMVNRKGTRCTGLFMSVLGPDDWIECPSCCATGQEFVGRCAECEGAGWLLVRKN
jgi:hypothetical protein